MKAFPALCLLFVLVYLRGALDRLGLPEIAGKFIVECALVLLVYPILRQAGNRMAPGWQWVAAFIGLTLLSGIVSGDGVYQSLLYFRWLLYAYLVFWAVWNASLSRQDIVRLNGLIVGLWILQVIASAYHVFVLGERVEAHVGTITAGSGTQATAFPLFALGYIMALYCYYRRSVWLLLLGLAFVLVGYSSGKRAIYFYLPIFYMAILLWYVLRERAAAALRVLIVPAVIFSLCIPVLVLALTQSKKFEHLQGESFWTVIDGALDVAEEYDGRVHASGRTSGRTATSQALLGRLVGEDWSRYCLGLGPGSLKSWEGEKRGKDDEDIGYGLVGWSYETISGGWPAMLAHLGFYLVLWNKVSRRRLAAEHTYARALHFGCHLGFAVYFLMYFTYMEAAQMAGWLTFAQMYVAAILLSPKHEGLLQPEAARSAVPWRDIHGMRRRQVGPAI